MTRFLFLLSVTVILSSSPFEVAAQKLEIQNTYQITGKAKRGALGDVSYDAGQGIYTLTYVTKSNEKKAKFQIYRFDNDFNFIDMTEDEVEFEKAKKKYTVVQL